MRNAELRTSVRERTVQNRKIPLVWPAIFQSLCSWLVAKVTWVSTGWGSNDRPPAETAVRAALPEVQLNVGLSPYRSNRCEPFKTERCVCTQRRTDRQFFFLRESGWPCPRKFREQCTDSAFWISAYSGAGNTENSSIRLQIRFFSFHSGFIRNVLLCSTHFSYFYRFSRAYA